MYSTKCPQRNWLKSLDMSLLARGEACNHIFQWHSMARPGQIFQWRNDFLAQSSTALQTNAISICSVYYVQSLYFFFLVSFISFIFPEMMKWILLKVFHKLSKRWPSSQWNYWPNYYNLSKKYSVERVLRFLMQWRKKKKEIKSGSRWEIATVVYGLYIWMDKMGEGQEHRLC